MGKEAYDDYLRYLRDKEANSTKYAVLQRYPSSTIASSSRREEAGADDVSKHLVHGHHGPTRATPSSSLKVGDLVLLEKNQRVPADMVLLHTSEEEGTCFIRTDQLDGETDWKLKVAVGETHKMGEKAVASAEGSLFGQSLSLAHDAVGMGVLTM